MLEYRLSSVCSRRRSPESHTHGSVSTALRTHIDVRARLEGRGAKRARARPSTRSMQGYGYGHPPPGCVKIARFVRRARFGRAIVARARRGREKVAPRREISRGG